MKSVVTTYDCVFAFVLAISIHAYLHTNLYLTVCMYTLLCLVLVCRGMFASDTF